MTKRKLPDFGSLDELVTFWETHSFADYANSTKPVNILVNLPPRTDKPQKIQIELDEALTRQIRDLARRRRVSPKRLVQGWIEENVKRKHQAA